MGIDKYRFNDLFPCSRDELASMGYDYSNLFDTLNITTTNSMTGIGGITGSSSSQPNPSLNSLQSGIGGTVTNGTSNSTLDDIKIARPDISQMIPFKPKFKWVAGEHRLPGGGFPLPPAAEVLCQSLPPPDSFQGPFVVVDRLMDSFKHMRLPNDYTPPPLSGSQLNDNTLSSSLFDTAKSAAWNEPPPDTHSSTSQWKDDGVRGMSRDRSRSPSVSALGDSKRMRFSKEFSRS